MLNSFSALVIFTLLGASVMAVPALAPKVEASEALLNCATQVWPHIAAPCLRTADEGAKILEARLVTARR